MALESASSQNTFVRLNILIALWAVALVLYGTDLGVGVSTDSARYLEAGRNLADGRGFVSGLLGGPLTDGSFQAIDKYPPGYPAVLGLLNLVGLEVGQAARFFAALLFGANVLLVGEILRRQLSVGAEWLAPVGAMLALGMDHMLRIHTMAWSEPLFFLLVFSGLYFAVVSLESSGRTPVLLGAGLVGLSALVRYVGVAGIAVIVVLVMVWKRRCQGGGWMTTVGALVLAGFPVVLWLLVTAETGGNVADRAFVFHPPDVMDLALMGLTLSEWLLPLQLPMPLKVLSLGLVIPALLWLLYRAGGRARRTFRLLWRRSEEPDLLGSLTGVLALFGLTYLALLIGARMFVDARVPFDYRILSPVLLCVIIVGALEVGRLSEGGDPGTAMAQRRIATLMVIVSVGVCLQATVLAEQFRDEGVGYNSISWRELEVWRSIEALPSHVVIYSNAPGAIWTRTRRRARWLPEVWSPTTLKQNPRLEEAVQRVRREVRDAEAVIVHFSSVKLDFLEDLRSVTAQVDSLPSRSFRGGVLVARRSLQRER